MIRDINTNTNTKKAFVQQDRYKMKWCRREGTDGGDIVVSSQPLCCGLQHETYLLLPQCIEK